MGKDKGASYERWEARYLSLWWSGGERDDVFWRNRVRVTRHAVNAEKQCGDLQAFHTSGLPFTEVFNVELKSGYSRKKTDATKKRLAAGKAVRAEKVRNTPWDLLEVVDSEQLDDNLTILNFWYQCEDDALLSCRIPLLIFKRDFHTPVVVIDRSFLLNFDGFAGLPPTRCLSFDDREQELHLEFFRHEDFFHWLTPEIVRRVHKCRLNS
jgi:hypothetical protein